MSYFQIKGTSMPALVVDLDQGESIVAESDAMVAMDTCLDLKGKVDSVLSMAMRSFTKDESMFQQSIVATRGPGTIFLASKLPGDIKILEIGNSQYCIRDGSFVACDSGVKMTTKFQKVASALFAKSGGFMIMQTSGAGKLAISSMGEIVESNVPPGGLIIDNNHVVAWENTLEYSVSVSTKKGGLLGNIMNSQMTGEGVVLRFKGRGKVYFSTRNYENFLSYLKSETSKK